MTLPKKKKEEEEENKEKKKDMGGQPSEQRTRKERGSGTLR